MRWIGLVVCIVLLPLFDSCISPTNGTRDSACQKVVSIPEQQIIVEKMEVLLAQYAPPPEHLLRPNAVKTTDDFDVTKYFQILTKSSVEEGYYLDYVQDFSQGRDGPGYRPELYARKIGCEPYRTFREFWDSTGDAIENTFGDPSFPPYLEHVRSDGSAEGYLQLFLLTQLGGSFYCSRNPPAPFKILCTHDALNGLLEQWDKEGRVRHDFLTKARQVDPTPRVIFDKDTVTVSVLYTETSWNIGVLSRINWTVLRKFPHLGVEVKTQIIFGYRDDHPDCSGWPPCVETHPRGVDAERYFTKADVLAQEELDKEVSTVHGKNIGACSLGDYKRFVIRFKRSEGDLVDVRYFLKEATGINGQPRWLSVAFFEDKNKIKVYSCYKKGEEDEDHAGEKMWNTGK